MNKWIIALVFVIYSTSLFSLPSLSRGAFGYNRDNQAFFSNYSFLMMSWLNYKSIYTINGELSNSIKQQGNVIPLGVDMSKLSETQEQLELDSYSDSLNDVSSQWSGSHPLIGEITRDFKSAIDRYNTTLQTIQEYPNKQIEKWNLPPQININADTHSRRLEMHFSEPMYLGF